MNHKDHRFFSTKSFRKSRTTAPLGFVLLAFVAASGCESIESEDAAVDATLRGSSSGDQTDAALSCSSLDRRVTADTAVTLRCGEGEVIESVSLRHGGTCEKAGGCAVPAGSIPPDLEQNCFGQRECEVDVSRLPFSCPSSTRTRLHRTDGRGGAAGQNRLSSTPVSSLTAWYECRDTAPQGDDEGEESEDDPLPGVCQALDVDQVELESKTSMVRLCVGDPSNPTGLPLQSRWYTAVDDQGTTCLDVFQAVAKTGDNDRKLRAAYRDICCNPKCSPSFVEDGCWPEPIIPVNDLDYMEETYGHVDNARTHPCDPLFWERAAPLNGQYPRVPSAFFSPSAMSGEGGGLDANSINRTCAEIYWLGRLGLYPEDGWQAGEFCHNAGACEKPKPQGGQPFCDVCPEGDYPLNPNLAVTGQFGIKDSLTAAGSNVFEGFDFLTPNGHEDPTCADLYWLGRARHLPADICGQVQSKMQNACGCRLAKSDPSCQ